MSVRSRLRALVEAAWRFGPGAAVPKLALLREMEHARLPDAPGVQQLHEVLCFLRAYPDDAALAGQVERMLRGFGARPDLRRERERLAGSGIAGTPTPYAFYWPTACWLAARWPERLRIDWAGLGDAERLVSWLPLTLPYAATPATDERDLGAREWIERLAAPGETDATFLVRGFRALPGDDATREKLFESFELPMVLDPGPGGPSRTLARFDADRPAYQRVPLDRARPDLALEVRRPPARVRAVSPASGRRLIDLAREAMVARSRDLDAFAFADPRDVRLVECGDGLAFACLGVVPERRLLMEAVYGLLTLKNGVPIGYVLLSSLFRSTAVAYNVFESFRGAEAARVFGRVIATAARLFGADSFSIDPYQLGHGNDEGLRSGAWWFYHKLGFRPDDPQVARVMRRELERMRRDPQHRSSLATLRRLVPEPVYLDLGKRRDATIGRLALAPLGFAAIDRLNRGWGARDARARTAASREAARMLGVRRSSLRSPGERLAWERWSPLVLALDGVERWSAAERRALAAVMRAKGGRRESDYVRLFDGHARLQRAVLRLVGE